MADIDYLSPTSNISENMLFISLNRTGTMRNKGFRYKLIFAIIGATGGFLYWKFVGCFNGTCPIKSVWYFSSLWGMTMGYLLGDLAGSFMMKRGIENDKKV